VFYKKDAVQQVENRSIDLESRIEVAHGNFLFETVQRSSRSLAEGSTYAIVQFNGDRNAKQTKYKFLTKLERQSLTFAEFDANPTDSSSEFKLI
jgi:hypothetical protein